MQDPIIQAARIKSHGEEFNVSAAPKDSTAAQIIDMEEEGADAEAEEAMRSTEDALKSAAPLVSPEETHKDLVSFEVDPKQVWTF